MLTAAADAVDGHRGAEEEGAPEKLVLLMLS